MNAVHQTEFKAVIIGVDDGARLVVTELQRRLLALYTEGPDARDPNLELTVEVTE